MSSEECAPAAVSVQTCALTLCGAERDGRGLVDPADALAALGLKQSPEAFGPDHLWSYTLGEKGTFAGGRLVMNIDGFYVKWDDVQTIHNLPCGYNFTQNAGKIKTRGIELESHVKF